MPSSAAQLDELQVAWTGIIREQDARNAKWASGWCPLRGRAVVGRADYLNVTN